MQSNPTKAGMSHPPRNDRPERTARSRTLTIAQAAALLGLSHRATLRLIRDGTIAVQRRNGRFEVLRSTFACYLEVQS